MKGIGVDTLSLDLGINPAPFPVHNSWLPSGRWGVECLANLDALPRRARISFAAVRRLKARPEALAG